jgi:acyl-CoA thioesterase
MSDADALARTIAETLLARETAAHAWGITLDSVQEGYARVRMTVRADMLNGHRTAHGGIIFALADSAFAYACNSRNQASVAQHASIAFLSPAAEGDVLVAEASLGAELGRSAAYTVTVRIVDGHPVAQFQGLSRTIGGSILPSQE